MFGDAGCTVYRYCIFTVIVRCGLVVFLGEFC